MKNPNDITFRRTEYSDSTVLEYGYNSLNLASYDYNSLLVTYKGCLVSPIVRNNGKYWIVIEIPAWWVTLNEKKTEVAK